MTDLGAPCSPPHPACPNCSRRSGLLCTGLPEQTTLFASLMKHLMRVTASREHRETPAEPGARPPSDSEKLCPVANSGILFFLFSCFSFLSRVEQQKALFSASPSTLVSQR